MKMRAKRFMSQRHKRDHAHKNSTINIIVSEIRCRSKLCIRKEVKQSLHAPPFPWNAIQHLSGMHPGQARYWLHNRQSLLDRPLWFLQTKHSRELTMWKCLSATNTGRYAWALLKRLRELSQWKSWIVCWPKEPVAPIPIQYIYICIYKK